MDIHDTRCTLIRDDGCEYRPDRTASHCFCVVDIDTWQERSLAPYNMVPLQLRHNGRDGVSNRQPHDC